jgi:hypothetical protein
VEGFGGVAQGGFFDLVDGPANEKGNLATD